MHTIDLSYFDVGVISLFYQFTLYVSLKLARQGFTLGELGLVSQGATALFMEVVNLTIAKVRLPDWSVSATLIHWSTDLAHYNAVYKDFQVANTSRHISTCLNPRLSSYRFSS